MLTAAQVAGFARDGFVVVPGGLDCAALTRFEAEYRWLIRAQLTRAGLSGERFDGHELDAGLFALEARDHAYVAELYDIAAQCPSFLALVAQPTLTGAVNAALGRPAAAPLYGFTQRCRIDPPRDDRRTYGWHQEVYYTIPHSRFVQTWAPLFRPTTRANGTIEVCVGSHADGVAPQTWTTPGAGRATQILVEDATVQRFEPRVLEMAVGDLLLFSGYLFHRSGQNTSDHVRYALVGMYHDVEAPGFRCPTPRFDYRGDTPEAAYRQRFGSG